MFLFFRRRSLKGLSVRVPAFQPDGPGSIPSDMKHFHFYLKTGFVSFVYVLSSFVSGGGPDSVLIVHSGRLVLVYLSSVLLLSLQASDPWLF